MSITSNFTSKSLISLHMFILSKNMYHFFFIFQLIELDNDLVKVIIVIKRVKKTLI